VERSYSAGRINRLAVPWIMAVVLGDPDGAIDTGGCYFAIRRNSSFPISIGPSRMSSSCRVIRECPQGEILGITVVTQVKHAREPGPGVFRLVPFAAGILRFQQVVGATPQRR
jgi:hypothetical protein